MIVFRDRPIKQKLVFIIMLTTAAALVAAGLGIVLVDTLLVRRAIERDLQVLARITADNTTAALAFNDAAAAAETLGALRARSHVVGACLYSRSGAVLAAYSRGGPFDCPRPLITETVRPAGLGLAVSEPVFRQGRRLGTLTFVYDLEEIDERRRIYGLTVLAVLLAAGLFAFVLSSRLQYTVTAPIARLVNASTAVSSSGDYAVRAEKLTHDELGLLVDRFNEMLARIQTRDAELQKAVADRQAALEETRRERERFRFLAESMPQKIFTARPDGSVDYCNTRWLEYTGLPPEGMHGSNWFQAIHPDDVEESLRLWRHSVRTGQAYHLEQRFRRADGAYRWHLTRAQAMRGPDGNIAIWIGSNTDIHEQKEEEAALRRANEDLQQFAYSASHDLQEPIRNVAIYSQIIARRYGHLLDADGREYLGFLIEGARRLATLVSDLLAYTRASMADLSETSSSAEAALHAALANLAEAIRESGGAVTHDPLPDVFMGESHLQQIFQNLIGNAIKYRSDIPPRIHVSAVRKDALWCFSVRDNGIGIDPQYKDRIFGVFKRLNHDRSYSGTGIGLAICQRVVERYGGRIWVESEPGQGATFYFTIPNRTRLLPAAPVESPAG